MKYLHLLEAYDNHFYSSTKPCAVRVSIPLGERCKLFLCGNDEIFCEVWKREIGKDTLPYPGRCWIGATKDYSAWECKIFLQVRELPSGKLVIHQHGLGHELHHFVSGYCSGKLGIDFINPDLLINEEEWE